MRILLSANAPNAACYAPPFLQCWRQQAPARQTYYRFARLARQGLAKNPGPCQRKCTERFLPICSMRKSIPPAPAPHQHIDWVGDYRQRRQASVAQYVRATWQSLKSPEMQLIWWRRSGLGKYANNLPDRWQRTPPFRLEVDHVVAFRTEMAIPQPMAQTINFRQ